jgi:hypothetical protein
MAKLDYSVSAGILFMKSGKRIELESPSWWQWLESEEARSFRFECDCGVNSYTVRRENIKAGRFWYGYKKVERQLHKSYIGRSSDLTFERLEAVARALLTPGKPRQRLPKALGNQSGSEVEKLKEILQGCDANFASSESLRFFLKEKLDAALADLVTQKCLVTELRVENERLQQELEKVTDELVTQKIYVTELQAENKRLTEQHAALSPSQENALLRTNEEEYTPLVICGEEELVLGCKRLANWLEDQGIIAVRQLRKAKKLGDRVSDKVGRIWQLTQVERPKKLTLIQI